MNNCDHAYNWKPGRILWVCKLCGNTLRRLKMTHPDSPEEKCCEKCERTDSDYTKHCSLPGYCPCHEPEISQEKEQVTDRSHPSNIVTQPSFIDRKVEEFQERFVQPNAQLYPRATAALKQFLRTALEEAIRNKK